MFYKPAYTCSKSTIKTLEQRCEIRSKLKIEIPKRRQWRPFGVFNLNFEHISHFCSSVSIVNLEHVITGWVIIKLDKENSQSKYAQLKVLFCQPSYENVFHVSNLVGISLGVNAFLQEIVL